MTTTTTTTTTIDLADTERALLARLVEHAIADLRVEVRRTRSPDFHDRLVGEERTLKELLEKLRVV